MANNPVKKKGGEKATVGKGENNGEKGGGSGPD